jgi:ABC-type transport system involved in multi-copper enzyme maturation permease subunit
MLWKEWRENAKWAVLALLAFGLATAYMVSQNSIDYNYYNASILSRVTPLTTFLAPLLATMLGLLQVASELRRDQWAFLVHRPVSRSTIFLGKAVAGVTLYLLAMSLPMLLLGLWLATPGNVPAPFTWGMMLPLIADILAGVAFYFAGMLTALRPCALVWQPGSGHCCRRHLCHAGCTGQ